MDTADKQRAADLVLGLLDPEDHGAARIRAIEDNEFGAEVCAWEERLAPLALGESTPPPPDVLARAETVIERTGQFLPGSVTLRAGDGEWLQAGPGLKVKILNRISALNRQTIMVDLAAGGEYPAHEHGQDEEIYMIAGDLLIGELTLLPGDFHIVKAGRRHPVHRTRSGCVCIISQAID